jgi:phage terminase large subunit-like protein
MARKTKRQRTVDNRAIIDADFPGLLEYLEAPDRKTGRQWWADLDTQLEALVWPRWRSPAPSSSARAAGAYFDVDAVARFLRFANTLRHIKGAYAKRRAHLIPDLWQVVHVIAPVFGWKRADGTRYYRELYLEVPRKNGKSTLVAVIGLYLLLADGEQGAEVYSVAKDRDQARAVWATGALMARQAPLLRRRLRIPPDPMRRGDRITVPRTDSQWGLLSRDRRGDKHHGLNVHGALIDELHTIADGELIGTIETGTGSRDQPLTVIITTAGIESESPVWLIKRDFAIKVAERVLEAPASWVAIFAADPKVALDGWQDPRVWADVNPGLGKTVRLDYLQAMAEKAATDAVELARFLRLHLGVPTEASVGYIDLPVWDRSAGLVVEEDLDGAECYGGLDLSDSRDLCAFVLVFPAGDGALDVVARVWTPAGTLTSRAMRDRADYVRWVAGGFLRTTPGETIDYDQVEDELGRLKARFDIRAVNYDRWGSHQLRDHLEAAGLPIVELGQGFASMSSPMKETARLITEAKVRHGGNPVLRFACAGMKALVDPAANVKPDKKRSTSRIDPMVALIMAIDAYTRREAPARSVYEDRGLEVAG